MMNKLKKVKRAAEDVVIAGIALVAISILYLLGFVWMFFERDKREDAT